MNNYAGNYNVTADLTANGSDLGTQTFSHVLNGFDGFEERPRAENISRISGGVYDTRLKNTAKQLEVEQIKHWMSKGAKLSLTLHNFLISQKVIEGKKLNALPKKTVQKKEEDKAAVEKPEAKPVGGGTCTEGSSESRACRNRKA